MAPIPSSPDVLLTSASRRLNDVESYQLPRLASCTNPTSRSELAAEARADLDEARRSLELCAELIQAQRASERESLENPLEEMNALCHRLTVEYRKAVLDSKKAISASRQRQRHQLPNSSPAASGSGSGPGQEPTMAQSPSQTMEDDALQTKTNEVTDALRRTTQTMQAELERSVLSVQMLEDSTRTLTSTSTLYTTYSSMLNASAQIIKQLEKANFYDRLIIIASFVFFLLCVGYVLKRRVVDKVGWWVGGSLRLVGMGLGLAARGVPKLKVDMVPGHKVLQDSLNREEQYKILDKEKKQEEKESPKLLLDKVIAPKPEPASAVGEPLDTVFGSEDIFPEPAYDPQPAAVPEQQFDPSTLAFDPSEVKVEILPNPPEYPERRRIEL